MGTGAHNRGAHNRGRARVQARAAERRTPAWVWWAAALMLAAATVPAVRAQAPTTAPPVTPGGPSAVPEVAPPTTPPGSGGDARTAPAPLGDTVVPQGGTARPVPDAGITASPNVVRPPAVGETPVIAPGTGSNMPVISPGGAAK